MKILFLHTGNEQSENKINKIMPFIIAVITIVGKDVEILEHSYLTGKNIKWCNHFGK